MAPPLAKQVLLAMGGDVAAKYGTLVMRKAPPAFGGEIAYTFARTGNGLYLANDVAAGGLVVRTASGGNARIEQLIDPVTGVLQNYLKLEAASSNWCLQSQHFNTSPWALTACTATENAVVAPDGTTTASYLVPSVANSLHYDSQAITITANEFLAWSGFVKSDGTYSGFAIVVSDAGVANGFRVGVDLTTGALNISTRNFGTGTYSGSFIIPCGGGWYYMGLWGAIGNSVTAATTFWEVFDTGARANTQSAFVGDAVHGIYVWQAQLERNGTSFALPPTSPIVTVAAKVDRNVESFSVPYFVDPKAGAPTWVYARFLERGTLALTSSGVPWQIGAAGVVNPRLLADASSGYRAIHQTVAGTVVSGTVGAVPVYGNVVETLALLFADGSVQALTSVNGAADVVGARSAALSLATAWNANVLYLNSAGSVATSVAMFSRFLVGTGGVSSIADVRNVL